MNFDVENDNFGNIFVNHFDSQNILSDENNDPDINFCNQKSEAVNPPDYNVDKINFSSTLLLFSEIHFLFCISTLEL